MSSFQPADRLFQMNPTGRFSDRADDYARWRPSYPPEAISFMLEGLAKAGPRLMAADIGAGTGIASRLLADRAVCVKAIEPNAAMREAAQPHPLVEFCAGTAEATGLADASMDLVLCAQAFHWFEHMRALPELKRILRPVGRLVVMWNDRDSGDPLTGEYGAMIRKASGHHPAAEDRGASAEALDESPLFGRVRLRLFRYEQPLTMQGLIGRARSASYCPKDGPKLDALVGGLTDLHRRFADPKGVVRMVYSTRVYIAEPAP